MRGVKSMAISVFPLRRSSQTEQFLEELSSHPSEGIKRVKILCPLPAISLCSLLACMYVAMPLHHRTHACHQRRSKATSLDTYGSLRIPYPLPRFWICSLGLVVVLCPSAIH